MGLAGRILNPVTRKRLRRFRRQRRAWYSLWILAFLYVLSLGAELLCNDRPLYVRFEGRAYFPAWRYYPEAAFLRNGRQTRPDYKALRQDPAFAGNPGNRMLFAPVPYGPLEIIRPESLRPVEEVLLTLAPAPHIGTVNVGPDLRVRRSLGAGHFFGVGDEAVAGLPLPDFYPLPEELRQAVQRRFRNEAAPPAAAVVAARPPLGVQASLSLSTHTPRARPPETVRLTLREANLPAGAAATLRFRRGAEAPAESAPNWEKLAPEERVRVAALAQACFEDPVYPFAVSIGGRPFRATLLKNDIRWPYPPTRGHWLGIDSAGRDVLARILYGLRISLSFGFLLVVASMVIGTLIGAVQGYYGAWIDITGQRLVEIWSALPFLYVMMLMGSLYGRSFMLLLVCYAIFDWIGISYYMRAEFLRLRGQPFVDAARCMGIPAPRIMLRHILPNALTPIITFFPFYLVGAIGSLAALDYLGFGLPAPTPSWGELLQQAQQVRWAWWLILYPALALFAVMLLGVFIGEGVREAYDPKPPTRMR